MRKAYKITVDIAESSGYTIYSAENAGKAKTMAVNAMKYAGYKDATYSWITSCRRFPAWDNLAQVYSGCIHWSIGNESWTHQFPGSNIPEMCSLDPMPTR